MRQSAIRKSYHFYHYSHSCRWTNYRVFNVRGLLQQVKKSKLSKDLESYGVDLFCLQETKIKSGCNKNVGKYRLICLKTTQKDYGNGFMISKRLEPKLERVWRVDDRISVLQIKLKKRSKHHILTIINVYAPHSDITLKTPEVTTDFYNKLISTTNSVGKKSFMTLVVGDFNAEVGEKTDIDQCMGRFSLGKRNKNGQNLIDYCTNHDLTLSNTCFQHKKSRLITWQQTRIVNDRRVKVEKTLDYICIPTKFKHLQNSRSYQGTLTPSDHNLLITKINLELFQIFKNINKAKFKKCKIFDTAMLNSNKEVQERHKEKVVQKLEHVEQKNWSQIKSAMVETLEN